MNSTLVAAMSGTRRAGAKDGMICSTKFKTVTTITKTTVRKKTERWEGLAAEPHGSQILRESKSRRGVSG